MKTLIFIHGGESFHTHEAYIQWLKEEYGEYIRDPWQKKIDE